MFKIGDLIRHKPYREGVIGSWVMFGDLGIIIALVKYNSRGKMVYRIKWIESWEESRVPEDFLEKVEPK